MPYITPLRPNEGQANDVALVVEAYGMALGCLVEVDRLGGIADVEVEHVRFGVVLDASKVMSAIVTLMASSAVGMP